MNSSMFEKRQDFTFSSNVICVIVTYAGRKDLLCRVLSALPEQGVSRAVVVDNGASWAVRDDLTAIYGDFVDVIEIGRNTGSAGGYAAGIQRAQDLCAEYIWLLDDDNRPAKGCLSSLLSAYARLRVEHCDDKLAVLAFRPEHQSDVANGVPVHRITPRRNAFRGFHVLDVPYKLWRRTPWGRPRVRKKLPVQMDLSVAPYSGLFFCRATIESIGLPREDFVLYADDHEYTYRLTCAGGRIVLITGALMEDLESSWNVPQGATSSFGILLKQGSDLRVYYSIRNGVYFDSHCLSHDSWMFHLNRYFFFFMLLALALLIGRTDRFNLVAEAAKDGLAGQLGLHRRFLL